MEGRRGCRGSPVCWLYGLGGVEDDGFREGSGIFCCWDDAFLRLRMSDFRAGGDWSWPQAAGSVGAWLYGRAVKAVDKSRRSSPSAKGTEIDAKGEVSMSTCEALGLAVVGSSVPMLAWLIVEGVPIKGADGPCHAICPSI